jgi:hypothetical protein
MNTNRISNIYQNFLDSHEYDKKFKNLDFDISWLEDKLIPEDILKLEETITKYSSLNYKTIFECGFIYAWELFNQCDAKKGNLRNE